MRPRQRKGREGKREEEIQIRAFLQVMFLSTPRFRVRIYDNVEASSRTAIQEWWKMTNGSQLMFAAAAALLIWFYVYRYWKWIRYLRWKWRVIPKYEQLDRHRRGLCVRCGYDLRGTPQKCPECGMVTPQPGWTPP